MPMTVSESCCLQGIPTAWCMYFPLITATSTLSTTLTYSTSFFAQIKSRTICGTEVQFRIRLRYQTHNGSLQCSCESPWPSNQVPGTMDISARNQRLKRFHNAPPLDRDETDKHERADGTQFIGKNLMYALCHAEYIVYQRRHESSLALSNDFWYTRELANIKTRIQKLR